MKKYMIDTIIFGAIGFLPLIMLAFYKTDFNNNLEMVLRGISIVWCIIASFTSKVWDEKK